MKPYKQVEATREAYHKDPTRNSVHRSSLLVPTMPHTDVEISFLNHFLLKRNYRHVACRVTAVDNAGDRIEARLYPVTRPKVYTLPLSQIFGTEAKCFLVDFFAADNLFVPFPAVMINHRGHQFVNVIHAYNRVLNDVFENDEINRGTMPAEASVDTDSGDGMTAFCLIGSGILPLKKQVGFQFSTGNETLQNTFEVEATRFSNRLIEFNGVFTAGNDKKKGSSGLSPGVLKITPPEQEMFFSRLFSGRRRIGGTFTANHSYYDSSATPEYWPNQALSYRAYPYFSGLHNRIRSYPIMSPGTLNFEIGLHRLDGSEISREQIGCLTSPGSQFIEANIDDLIRDANVPSNEVGSFSVYASPTDGNTPTRINHQLMYGSNLFCSINVSLKNNNNFIPKSGQGLTWGQVLAGGNSEGVLGVIGDDPNGLDCEIELTLYDTAGEVARSVHNMASGSCVIVDLAKALGHEPTAGEDGNGSIYWYVARSSRPDLTAISLSHHAAQQQTTGEHGF